jgi:hypothetical protein
LAKYFERNLGKNWDWLCEYRKWLDTKGIPAEVNGWASAEAFNISNALTFINEKLGAK